MSEYPTLLPSQLRVGLFVVLDLPWQQHAFFSNEFKIGSEADLKQLRELGLKRIAYDPARSDVSPLGLVAEVRQQIPPEQRREDIEQRRQALKRCERAFIEVVDRVRSLSIHLRSNPREAIVDAQQVVELMLENLLVEDGGALLQLINARGKPEKAYHHAVNVSSLSLLLGNALGLTEKPLQQLGLGALLHDLGEIELPGKILRKKGVLTKAERELFNLHPLYGRRIAERLGSLSDQVVEIIGGHHEMLDGRGFPEGIGAATLSLSTRIVCVVNSYDNLCNPIDATRSKSPFEAMAYLYSRAGQKYDAQVVGQFIANMGVYPPGTAVRLTDGSLGLVLNANPQALLRPWVMIYDPDVPRQEALVLDLRQHGVEVVKAVAPDALDEQQLAYFNLQGQQNDFFDPSRVSP